MNILLIENQPYASQITSKRDDITVYDGSLSQSVEVVAEDIKTRYGKLEDVFIIDIHLQIGNAQLSENAGIKLLKLLRLHYIDTHVVLYSWMSREMLMSNLRNAIVFSKGVSFCRLPYFLNAIQGIDFSELSHETAEKNELLQLFRAEYDPDDRHFDANMFGVWQLLKVQVAYEKAVLNQPEIENVPALQKTSEYMNSYNGKLVQFIYEEKGGDIVQSIIKAMDDDSCAVLNETKKLLESIDEEIAFHVAIEDPLKENEELIKELENQKKEIKQFCERQDDIKSLWFRKQPPCIIYVDDMAVKGWADVLQRIVYGGPNDKKFFVVPVKGQNTDQIVSKILQINERKSADLLILDLRLKEDERGYIEPSRLSGVEVLQKINANCFPCPILIFTASNKIWSLKETFKGNVMAYWNKGVLEQNDEIDTYVKNYMDLVNQIFYLTKSKWILALLSDIQRVHDKIVNNQNHYWWEYRPITYKDSRGNEFDRILTNRDTVISILKNTIDSVQNGLRQLFFHRNGTGAQEIERSLVLHLSFVLEEIHKYEEIQSHPIPLSSRMRVDKEYKTSYNLRNSAAHGWWLKYTTIQSFVGEVLNYLEDEQLGQKYNKKQVAHCYEAVPEPSVIEDVSLTPMGSRWIDLIEGKEITVRIVEITKQSNSTKYCFLFQTEKNLCGIIDDMPEEVLSVGDIIIVKQDKKHKINSRHIVRYCKVVE